jgi:hypothetical protein
VREGLGVVSGIKEGVSGCGTWTSLVMTSVQSRKEMIPLSAGKGSQVGKRERNELNFKHVDLATTAEHPSGQTQIGLG